uniref:Uncharacterized protein n=1 Tax=Romanomermis culicivorax TaxID=13658 RepID=A0A915HU01_ROMCU
MKFCIIIVGLLALFIASGSGSPMCCCYGSQRLSAREGCGDCDFMSKPDTFVKCVGGRFVELKCPAGKRCYTDSSMLCGQYECW